MIHMYQHCEHPNIDKHQSINKLGYTTYSIVLQGVFGEGYSDILCSLIFGHVLHIYTRLYVTKI